jgi:hypothetical protein
MRGSKSELDMMQDSGKKPRKRKWSVTAVGMLLIFQAVFLACIFPILVALEFFMLPPDQQMHLFSPAGGISPLQFSGDQWLSQGVIVFFGRGSMTLPPAVLSSLVFSCISLPLLLVGIAFLAGWRHSWTMAVLFQGLILAFALGVYFRAQHSYIYPVMVFGITMVLYLNYYDVLITFQPIRNHSGE